MPKSNILRFVPLVLLAALLPVVRAEPAALAPPLARDSTPGMPGASDSHRDLEIPAGGTRIERIALIDPPEQGFFSKQLHYDGIPIKAHRDVSDEALWAARQRLEMMLGKVPSARERLRAAGAELHIIGRNQVTSDLPDYRHLRGKPFAGTQTVDERTRGLGGLRSSCGEENLLKLPKDRYRGRDICVHEFAHNIFDRGMTPEVRRTFQEQYRRSLDQGLWAGAYAATNPGEFFAELSMWYFGTHGDLRMKGPPPGKGPEGLRAYDPEAFELFDRFYRGHFEPETEKGDILLF